MLLMKETETRVRQQHDSPVERLRQIADALLSEKTSYVEAIASQNDEISSLERRLAALTEDKDQAFAGNCRMQEQHENGACCCEFKIPLLSSCQLSFVVHSNHVLSSLPRIIRLLFLD
jgi:hypothetical protein